MESAIDRGEHQGPVQGARTVPGRGRPRWAEQEACGAWEEADRAGAPQKFAEALEIIPLTPRERQNTTDTLATPGPSTPRATQIGGEGGASDPQQHISDLICTGQVCR